MTGHDWLLLVGVLLTGMGLGVLITMILIKRKIRW
jgi:hypothetical protein